MPWSGGVFSRTDGTRNGATVWTQAKNAGVKIVASDHDTHDQDLATGINACLKKDGGNTVTANIPFGGYQITNFGGAQHKTGGATYTGTATWSGVQNFNNDVTFGAGNSVTFNGSATFANPITLNGNQTVGSGATQTVATGAAAVFDGDATFNGSAVFVGEVDFSGAMLVGALANVVEDTTPQLGGDLDAQNNVIESWETKIITRTGNFTCSAADTGATYLVNSAGTATATLPNSLGVGWHASFVQYGSGAAAFAAASGASLLHPSSHTKTNGQYTQAALTIIKNTGGSAAEYALVGDTA